MERPALDQAVDLLVPAERVLLIAPAEPSDDAFASMVGLSLALEALGKSTTMVSAAHVPSHLQFLPGTSQVAEHVERTSELVVEIPVGDVRPADVRWDVTGETLRVTVTPERGKVFPEATPTASAGRYPWEVIVTVGSPDIPHLGEPFASHAPFFYDTPIANVDHGTANEFFGTVNLVSATASTTAEVVFELIDALGGVNLLTPDVATCLYAAILTGTRSFQSPATSPRTFAVAASLLEQEADRQTVTRHLFKTHTLPELRLLGRGLARLQELRTGTLWTLLAGQDFVESAGTPDIVPAVLQEIVERVGEQSAALLAFERSPGVLEALIAPGRLRPEERALLEERTNGTPAGPFLLVALGAGRAADAERPLRELVLPHLPVREPAAGG